MFRLGLRNGFRNWAWLSLAALATLVPTGYLSAAVVTNASLTDLKTAIQSGDAYIALQFNGTITLSNTLNLLPVNIVIDATGFNVTLSGGTLVSLLNVAAGQNCTVSNVIFSSGKNVGANGVNGSNGSNGNATDGGDGGNGGVGADGKGGAIQNFGALNLVNCTLLNNSVVGGNGGNGGNGGSSVGGSAGNGGNAGAGGGAYGGAVYNQGTLVLTNCYLANNSVLGGNGGFGGTNGNGPFAYPGSGAAGGTGAGGCVYSASGSSAALINCTFAFSSAQGGNSQTAGTPHNGGDGINGQIGGPGLGGGVCNLATGATLINCTFYQDSTTGGNGGNGGTAGQNGSNGGNGGNGGNAIGGGFYNAGIVTVANSTFSGGSTFPGTNGFAGAGPFPANDGVMGAALGDCIANAAGTLNLQSSLLSKGTNSGINAYGTITDQGLNISSDNTPPSFGANSRKNTDPKLDVLDFYVNPAPSNTNLQTVALKFGSPALGFGGTPLLPFDERGAPRPAGASDSGAFESTVLHNISGAVRIGSGALGSVGLTASNASAVVPASTDSNGQFAFNHLAPGTYAVSVNAFYTNSSGKLTNAFIPASTNVSLSGSDVPNVNFTATTGGMQRIKGLGSLTNLTNHALLVSFQVLSNRVYRIQSNTNLAGTNWVTVATNGSGNAGVLFYTNSMTNSGGRFFRVVTP